MKILLKIEQLIVIHQLYYINNYSNNSGAIAPITIVNNQVIPFELQRFNKGIDDFQTAFTLICLMGLLAAFIVFKPSIAGIFFAAPKIDENAHQKMMEEIHAEESNRRDAQKYH